MKHAFRSVFALVMGALVMGIACTSVAIGQSAPQWDRRNVAGGVLEIAAWGRIDSIQLLANGLTTLQATSAVGDGQPKKPATCGVQVQEMIVPPGTEQAVLAQRQSQNVDTATSTGLRSFESFSDDVNSGFSRKSTVLFDGSSPGNTRNSLSVEHYIARRQGKTYVVGVICTVKGYHRTGGVGVITVKFAENS